MLKSILNWLNQPEPDLDFHAMTTERQEFELWLSEELNESIDRWTENLLWESWRARALLELDNLKARVRDLER